MAVLAPGAHVHLKKEAKCSAAQVARGGCSLALVHAAFLPAHCLPVCWNSSLAGSSALMLHH